MKTLMNAARWLAITLLFAVAWVERALEWILETLMMPVGIIGVVGVPGPDNPEQIGGDVPDGSVWPPRATSLAGEYGMPPITQPTNPSQAPMSYALGQSAIVLYSSTQSPSAVNANTASEQSFTVTGITGTTSLVFVNKPAVQSGLGIGTARASAANTIQVTFFNVTAGNLTPTASEAYLVIEIRGPMVQSYTLSAAATAGTLSPQPTAVAATTTSIQTLTATVATGFVQGLSHSKIAQQSVARSSAAVTMPGGRPQTVIVNKPTAQSGLALVGARISVNNGLELTFMNVTASPITPTASEVYLVAAFRGVALKTPIIEFDVNVGTLAAINTTNSTEQTVGSVVGLAVGDQILAVGKPTSQAGVLLGSSRLVGTISTLPLAFAAGANGATPTASEVYRCPVWKTGLGSAGGASGGGRQIAQQFTATLSVAAVATIVGPEQTFANITGLITAAPIMVNLESALPVGLGIGNIRVSATGTLAIAFTNVTGATIPAFTVTVNILQFGVQGSIVLTGTGTGVTFPFDEQHQQLQEVVAALQAALDAKGTILGN